MENMNAQLQQMMQQKNAEPEQGDAASAPSAAPMSVAQPKEGEMLEAKNQVTIAMVMLEQALLKLGSHTEEGRIVMGALTDLSKKFHKEKNEELVPAQLMSMMQSMPQVGGGSPEQLAMAKAQQQPQQQQPQGAGAPPSM